MTASPTTRRQLVRVHNFGVSIDGFATGEGQALEAPFGHAGIRLHEWFSDTAMAYELQGGGPGGSRGIDNALIEAGFRGFGAEIMGRNKFGPQRGPWADESWQGWWGENPPFHTPVYVLTHHLRPSLKMAGGTTFHFRDASPQDVLAEAKQAADGLDVHVSGGPTVVRDFLAADLVDLLHVVVVPIVLGRGVRLWDGLEGVEERFEVETTASPRGVSHVIFSRRAS
ncbi:dihydrofolate reductase family protein [Nonomuraea sp. NPDC050536]|uniref:dihydrofolate reductase family protein n=1 Tax=Nonomuraea sp. NPDC050536 TaxID=3364366 RepID=UPI0037C9B05E